jgi:hypothetical protein
MVLTLKHVSITGGQATLQNFDLGEMMAQSISQIALMWPIYMLTPHKGAGQGMTTLARM